MDAAFGALGKRFLDGLLGALRPHRDGHDFAAVLFLQAQRFFERESVRLIGFKSDVGFANPRAVTWRSPRAQSFAGTCLMQTPIFTINGLPSA